MNTIVKAILFFLLTGLTPIIAQSDVKEQLVVPLTDPGKPGFIEVGLINGFIHVVGYNGKEVIIDAVASARTKGQQNEGLNEDLNENLNSRRKDNSGASAGMKRIPTGNAFDLSAEEKNNRVKVSASSHQKPVNLVIKVPQRFSLKLSAINNGDITVENVNGELEISNINGPIELTNISGSAVAHTINGDLKATFRDIANNAPMAFSTLNGRIDVTFPSSMKAAVKMKTDRGDIFSDFDIDIDKNQPKASRSGQSGMYRVTVEDWVYGKINGGGPEVMMKSMQGSIYFRKAK